MSKSKGNRGGNAGHIRNLVPRQVKVTAPPTSTNRTKAGVNPNMGGAGVKDISEITANVERVPASPKDTTPAPKIDGGNVTLT